MVYIKNYNLAAFRRAGFKTLLYGKREGLHPINAAEPFVSQLQPSL